MGYKANIFVSMGTKFLGSFITLGISVITARELGKERLGEISLVVLAVAISMLISGILSGPPLIYFTPRKRVKHLIVPAYIANIFCSTLVCLVMAWADLFNPDYLIYAILISLCQSMFSTHFYIMLGLEKLMAYNIIGVIQALISIVTIAIMVYVFSIKEIHSYFIAQAGSYLVGFFMTLPFLKQSNSPTDHSTYWSVTRDIFKYGFITQVASVFQQLNYRLSYYVIHSQLGLAKLGIFALTMQIAEGVLLIARSISVVLFSKTANLTDKGDILQKTTSTLKFTYASTFLLLAMMLILPVSFYEAIFSKDFSETKIILWFIAPGIMFLSIQTILSSYYSSIGKVGINAIGSLIGLIVIALIIYPATMVYDLKGAAVSNVISYLFSMLTALVFYKWVDKNQFRKLILGPQDFKRLFS